MKSYLKNIIGMGGLSDQMIAMDFLTAAKNAVRNYAAALSESTSADLRNTLKEQLNDAINTHEAISDYMMQRGYYHAYDLQKQIIADFRMTKTALRHAKD